MESTKKKGIKELNDWVEDTLFCVILRRRYDAFTAQKNILHLFRLLAILYKISHGSQKKAATEIIDADLLCVLECKVVNAALMYFEEPVFNQKTNSLIVGENPTRKNRKRSKSRKKKKKGGKGPRAKSKKAVKKLVKKKP